METDQAVETLVAHIASKSRPGIPYSEAVQLLFLLYMTLDFLPKELRDLPLTKERLAASFSMLTASGLVLLNKPNSEGVAPESADPRRPAHWLHLIKELLMGRIDLDDSFNQRACRYI